MRFSLPLVLFPFVWSAQTTDATLSGVVHDPSRGALVDCLVTLANARTGVIFQTSSNHSGVYSFPSVAPGDYRVSVFKQGFQKAIFPAVALGIGSRLTLDVTLEISPSTEAVEVSADAESALSYSTSSIGGMVTARKVIELPITSRNALGLVSLQAGVVGDNFAGARIGTLNIQIDGVNVQDGRINSGVASTIFPSTDRIEEFRVVTSPVDAELGRGSGQIQLLTRSGGNQFHGSLFEFHRNTVLNANTWFNNQRGLDPATNQPVSPRNNLIRNQFGARFGGPILKNRTFFHILYEGQRVRTRNAITSTVLTSTARNGIFRFFPGLQNGNADSANPVVNLSGAPARPNGSTADLQSVSVFGRDPARLAPDATGVVAQQLAMLPLPNNFRIGDGLNTAGYTWRRGANDDLNQINIKIDHILRTAHRLTFSYSRDAGESVNGFLPQPFPGTTGGSVTSLDYITSFGLTSTLLPNLVHEFRAGALRPRVRFYAPWERNSSNLPRIANQPYLPTLITVTDPLNGGNDPQGRISPNYQLFEKMSWLKGKHSVKAGGQVWFASTNGFNAFTVMPRANFGAGGAPVRNLDQITGIGRNQAAAQNLLLDLSGSVANIQQAFNSPGGPNPVFVAGEGKQRTWRDREFALFLQDDWKLSRNVTINLGLRYEYYGIPWDANGRTAGLVGGSAGIFGLSGSSFGDLYQPGRLAGALTSLELVGPNSPHPDRRLYNRDWNNFAPAIGLAWNIPHLGHDKTVFRAGYSMGYERSALRLVDVVSGDQPGLRTVTTFNSGNALNLSNVRLPLQPSGKVLEDVSLLDRTQTVRAFDSGLRTPYVQNWNAQVQRTLPGRTTLAIRYVGNKGTKLIRGYSVNETLIRENGLLDAFLITQAGGNAPLFDRLLRGLNVNGVGIVDGVRITGSQIFRQANTTTQGQLASHNLGGFAAYLNNTTYITNQRGGLLRNGGFPENFIVGNPQFDSARLFGNVANSSYHSMQWEVIKRYSAGFLLQANYTWSKALGEEEGAAQEIVDSYRDNRNRRLDKRLLNFHLTHVVRSNVLWELPFGPRKKFLASENSILSHLAGGWQIGSIFNLFSGQPLALTSGVASFNNFGDNTPVAVTAIDKGLGQVKRTGNGVVYFEGLNQTIDPSVSTLTTSGGIRGRSTLRAISDSSGKLLLVNPTPGLLGSLAPRFLEGPGEFRLDLNFIKTIRIAESKNLQLEGIFESATNSPQFNNPNTDINSLNFGRITGAGGARIIVLGARFNF